VDVRSKLFAVLHALGFESTVALTPEEEVTLAAAKAYVPFASAEAWQDAKDEFAQEGFELLPADQERLDAELLRAEGEAQEVLSEQQALTDGMRAAETEQEAAELKRVRVLRDGPMYGVPKMKRATSLFRARIEAKARIAGMVAASKVAYRGPKPTPAEYADATLKAATAALLEAGVDPSNDGFTLQHVPPALMAVAQAAGIDTATVTAFLKASGIGLTSTGKLQAGHASLDFVASDKGTVTADVKPLDKYKGRKVSPTELRELCIAFQEEQSS